MSWELICVLAPAACFVLALVVVGSGGVGWGGVLTRFRNFPASRNGGDAAQEDRAVGLRRQSATFPRPPEIGRTARI